MPRRLNTPAKLAVIALLFALVALLQLEYDANRTQFSATAGIASGGMTPVMVRMLDMGFHPAVASFLWATTMPEILDLWERGRTEYFPDLAFVNAVDPKLSYPYAFSVLTLTAVPTSSYPDAFAQSVKIGEAGMANADPDWRIPYYMATNEFLYAHDQQKAAWYYNLAAQTPGVPQYAARFALNFGIETNQRKKTEELWATIRDSSNDPATKARAQAFIDHLQIFDYLDAASAQYRREFGAYPTSTTALVAKGVIPAVPPDPFGFSFIVKPDGTTAIDQNRMPSSLMSLPTQ
jgi:hypothetical protein